MRSTVSDPPRATASGATVDGSDVVLRDGSTIHLRRPAPEDVEGVAAFLRGLSPDATRFRFLGPGPQAGPRGARRSSSAAPACWRSPAPRRRSSACMLHPERALAPSSPSRSTTPGRVAGIATLLLAHLAQFAAGHAAWRPSPRGSIPPTTGCFMSSATRASRSRCAPSRANYTSSSRPSWAGGDRPLRGARPDRAPWRQSVTCSQPASIAVDRRLAPAGERRRSGRAQPRCRRFAGAALPDQPARPTTIAGRPCLRIDRRRARTRRAGRRGGRRAASCPRPRGSARSKGVRALVVLSAGFGEDGRLRARALQAELLGICRADGHAARRAQLPRRAQHRPGGARWTPRSRPVARRRAASRFASQSGAYGIAALDDCRARAALGCPRSSRWATRPTSRATTSCASGSRIPAPTRCCSTSSRSATRGASARSRGG